MNKKKEKPKAGYFAIIPAPVRYDGTLAPNEKLFYGELSALSNDRGYCFATNAYFAKEDRFNVSPKTVSRWVSNLRKRGYVVVVLVDEQGEGVSERRIYLRGAFDWNECVEEWRGWNINVEGALIKLWKGVEQKSGGGYLKIEDYNIKGNNQLNSIVNIGGDYPPQTPKRSPQLKDNFVVYEFSKKIYEQMFERVVSDGKMGGSLREGFWRGKEGKNMKSLNLLIKERIEKIEKAVDLDRWKKGVEVFWSKFETMKDGWFRDNALTPSGVLQHYDAIYLKMINENSNGKADSKPGSRHSKKRVKELFKGRN